jgi:hypothetical protein
VTHRTVVQNEYKEDENLFLGSQKSPRRTLGVRAWLRIVWAVDAATMCPVHAHALQRTTNLIFSLAQVSFTCNRCGARNVHSVNPLAWRSGTVFIQCGGCKVKHKMVDHLNLCTDYGSGITLNMTRALERQHTIRSVMPNRMAHPDSFCEEN